MRTITLLLCSVACSLAMHREPAAPTHGYHVHMFKIRATSPPPHNVINAMNHTMDLTFKAGAYTFHLDLRLKTLQWGKNARIVTGVDENGKETTMELFHRAYTGKAYVEEDGKVDAESGDVSLTFFPDKRFTVVVSTAHDLYNIDLNEFMQGGFLLKGKDNGHRMHMTRFSDMSLGDAHADEHVSDPIRSRIRKYLMRKAGGRRLNQLIPFDGCFSNQASTQRAIKIGLVADPAYYQLKAGSTSYNSANDATVVTAMLSELNKASDLVYSKQLRVWLLQGDTFVGAGAASLPMSTIGCGVDGSSRLTSLRTWRSEYEKTYKDTNALWHLLTNCHPPPGTVGIAYIGVICSKSYGAGWTNNVYTSTWLTLAHELGHNFGSPHSFDNGQGRTGGIMDYGDGYYPAPTPSRQKAPGAEYAFNPLRKNDICGAIVKSLTSSSSWNIAPNTCWTVYSPTSTPVVTPRPTTPLPTMKPTLRPTQVAQTTTKTPTNQPTTRPTNRPTTSTTRTSSPTPPPTIVSYGWVLSNPLRYGTCSPSCGAAGSGLQLPLYDCMRFSVTGSTNAAPVKVTDAYCDQLLKPTDPSNPNPNEASRACDPPNGVCPSATCGDGIVQSTEVCDPGTNLPANSLQRNACCLPDCSGYKYTSNCLTKNKMIDAAFMKCLNDIQHSNCYVYLFQGEYFNKFYAVPGHRYFYSQAWTGARKHMGIVQPTYPTVTAVAGGQNGRIYVFNGLNYQLVDYSDESNGKVLASGTLTADYGLSSNTQFTQCGKVTAADIYYERWLLAFCDQIYTWINVVGKYSCSYNYPAGNLFYGGLSTNEGVNAFYVDDRYNTMRIFRRDFQSSFISAGFMTTGQSNATTGNIFQDGISTNTCPDPNCITCATSTECSQCTNGYTVKVARCIPDNILVDMTFAKNSPNDAFYSTDPALKTATFVADHGGNPNSAMVFTPTTQVTAHAPGLNGKEIQNFRIEVFYKPRVGTRQTLLQIDNRFTINFTVVNVDTFKVFVSFDHLTFDCYVNSSLTVGQWNTIAVEMAARQIITYVNGMQHNRGYSQIAGGPPLPLTFQKVVVGATSGGLDGELDSLVISEVPVTSQSSTSVVIGEEPPPPWVIPVAIVGTILSFCLIAGLVYLCYSRGLCGKETNNSNNAQAAFLNASDQNASDQQYVRMT